MGLMGEVGEVGEVALRLWLEWLMLRFMLEPLRFAVSSLVRVNQPVRPFSGIF